MKQHRSTQRVTESSLAQIAREKREAAYWLQIVWPEIADDATTMMRPSIADLFNREASQLQEEIERAGGWKKIQADAWRKFLGNSSNQET